MKKITSFFFLMICLVCSTTLQAQTRGIDPKNIVDQFVDSTGRMVTVVRVPGIPPPGIQMLDAAPSPTAVTLTNVPAFDWSFGCSATSAAMMAGYYDRTGYYNMYDGPTQGGLMPMDNSSWGTVVISGETRAQCPLSATRNGVDGRSIRGHVDDYWIKYGNNSNDPYISGGWAQHTWGECTGDYMGTNQSALSNSDGNTTFWFYNDGSPMCNKVAPAGQKDGCFGMREFFVSRGYTVLSNCTQLIYNSSTAPNGITFAQYRDEIDHGRPALIQIDGHTMLGFGYDITGSLIYLHDTWNYGTHTMTWGGSYGGGGHWGITKIQLQAITPNPCDDIISLGGGGSVNSKTYWGGGVGVWYNSTVNACGFSSPGIEQIYSFVAPVTGYYSIQVTNANTWVDYMWKTGACNNSGWTCIDDIASAGTYGSMYWTAGTTYYLLLDDEDNTESAHTFFVFLNPCLNVTSIGGTGAGWAYSYTGGGNGAWNTSTNSACGWTCPGREKIYSFVAPQSGLYSFVVTAAGGFVDYMWKSGSCASTGWTCVDDIASPGTYGDMQMTQGQTYYILLDDENTTAGTHTFYLSLTTPAGSWLGTVSNDWYNPLNWSAGLVPISTTNVTINTGYTYYPIIGSGTAYCNSITTGPGTLLKINAGDLIVSGDMTITGQLAMDHASGSLTVNGDIYWESGSTANITAASIMWIYGFWEFKSGANVQLANGYVDFAGSTDTYIRTYAPNCSFYNVGVYKSAGHFLGLSYLSTYDLTINGYLGIQPNATFSGASAHSLILRGSFYNNYHFAFDYGTLVMDGANQSITPGVGDYLNNLTISPTGTTTVNSTYSTTLTVKGSVIIQSGVFDPLNNTVEVRGNWTNAVGPAAFTEGTGKVTFNSTGHNYVLSNETFYTIEANMVGSLRVDDPLHTVTCSYYDWTTGNIDILSGTFTANNLVDNGLYGGFYVNPGGTLNLNNPDGWVDLHGNIYVLGGTMNVYGGNGSDSFWPYNDNGSVTISSGTLDIKNVGVVVYDNAFTLTENITGGTIRTSRGFTVSRADYTPTGGVVEFYGPTNGSFYTINGGYVRNVIVNKGVADNSSGSGSNVVRNRLTGEVTDAPLANTITLGGDADINGSVTIQAGVLSAGTYYINVEGDWDNQVGTAGFVEGTSTVTFNGSTSADILNGETFYNFWEDKTNPNVDAVELMSGKVMSVTNNLWLIDGSLELNSGTTLNSGVDLSIANGAGINANDGYIAINVAGNWTNYNSDYDYVHGFDPGYYSTVTFNGTTDQYMTTSCVQEDFANLTINKTAGKFRSNDNTQSYGNILIQQGSWHDNLSMLTHTVWGNFTVASTGSFLTSSINNTVEFKGSQNSVFTYSNTLGYFRNLLVNKTVGYGVTQATDINTQWGGNITIGSGTYSLGGNLLVAAGDVAVNSTGVLSLPAASLMVLTDTKTLNVNTGGRINIAGTAGSPVTIRANEATLRYNFNVNSGGTIAADYCVFKNVGASGVNVKSGASIDMAHSFKGCTFQDGTISGTLLTIDNNETRTIRDAVFPTNTWGGGSNVTKAVNAGKVSFVDYSGAWSGEANDNDFYNRVHWVPTLISAPTATPATICLGSTSQLQAVVSGGDPPYTYAWTPAASLSNPAVENPVASPSVTTPYSVLVTDELGTTFTGNVTVTVLPILTPSVTIVASANPAPPGDIVNFTATPVNGGSSPTYQWKVNGGNVGTGPTYNHEPVDNDHVTCEMTSNYPCVTANPVTSNTITMIMVPVNQTVTGGMTGPLSLCFDATNTITVAGGGSTFIVRTGASAVMIAGVRISILPGATVESGGYLHGYITTTNGYCGIILPTMPAVMAGQGETTPAEALPASLTFSLYPNPTTGIFSLYNKGDIRPGNVQVEMFDLRGNQIYSTTYGGERDHQVTLPPLTPGLYFVKVISGELVESFKVIVTR